MKRKFIILLKCQYNNKHYLRHVLLLSLACFLVYYHSNKTFKAESAINFEILDVEMKRKFARFNLLGRRVDKILVSFVVRFCHTINIMG